MRRRRRRRRSSHRSILAARVVAVHVPSRVGSPFCGACRDKVLPERERKQKAREEKEEKGEDPAAVDESSDADTDADTDAAVAAAMEEMDEDIDDDDPAPPKSKRKRKRKADRGVRKADGATGKEARERKQVKKGRLDAQNAEESGGGVRRGGLQAAAERRAAVRQISRACQVRGERSRRARQDPLCGRRIGSDEDIKKQFAISGRVDIAARVKDGKAIVAKIEENRRHANNRHRRRKWASCSVSDERWRAK